MAVKWLVNALLNYIFENPQYLWKIRSVYVILKLNFVHKGTDQKQNKTKEQKK